MVSLITRLTTSRLGHGLLNYSAHNQPAGTWSPQLLGSQPAGWDMVSLITRLTTSRLGHGLLNYPAHNQPAGTWSPQLLGSQPAGWDMVSSITRLTTSQSTSRGMVPSTTRLTTSRLGHGLLNYPANNQPAGTWSPQLLGSQPAGQPASQEMVLSTTRRW